jgi:hypothetical protein
MHWLTAARVTVFDCKGVAATRRERIGAAVEAAGQHLAQAYEGLDCGRSTVSLQTGLALRP